MKRSISRQLLELHSPSSDPAVESTITCTICQAVYAPSRHHDYLLQAPPIVRESAFMSMCHFCFRCRRPSCPNCWDTVHSVCGQCAHETRVPFRLETPPLEGIPHLSPPSSLSVDQRSISPSLISIRPGRFQKFSSSPIDSMNTRTDRFRSSQVRFPTASAGTFVGSSPMDIDKIETRPDRSGALDIDRIETRPDRSVSLNVDKRTTHSDLSVSRKRKFARLLIALSLLLLFLIVIGIAVAFISTDMNILIYRTLHIDIRAEFISLWHFLNNLF